MHVLILGIFKVLHNVHSHLFVLIQCEVAVLVKVSSSKIKSCSDNAFEVLEPSSKVTIPPHSSIYAKVSFCPAAMQTYSANFEATCDYAKVKGLTFEIQGEGNLPQVTLIHPTLRNSKGVLCMLFKQISLKNSQALPLTLINKGTIPSSVTLDITKGSEAFRLDSQSGASVNPDEGVPAQPMHFTLETGETRKCVVRFSPKNEKKYKGDLRLRVKDNMFERQNIQLIGEGYKDDIFISNIRGMVGEQQTEMEQVLPEVFEGKIILFYVHCWVVVVLFFYC